ncbi:MAG: phosphonate ABC transporter ATP-binding protein, partial [Armatimonadetes bacterium]|nr:phosphonate ABC transporter ATP-binding protein [Anaerolineae bacterium]
DRSAAETLDALLHDTQAAGRTVLLATHQFEQAAQLTQRVIILGKGVLVYDAPTAGLDAASLAELFVQTTQ